MFSRNTPLQGISSLCATFRFTCVFQLWGAASVSTTLQDPSLYLYMSFNREAEVGVVGSAMYLAARPRSRV